MGKSQILEGLCTVKRNYFFFISDKQLGAIKLPKQEVIGQICVLRVPWRLGDMKKVEGCWGEASSVPLAAG